MPRPLAISKRQAKSLLKAAEEERAIIEVQTAIGTIRLIPNSLAKPTDHLDEAPEGYL